MSTHSAALAAACALGLFSSAALADSPNLGKVITPGEVAPWDISVSPDGAGLPSGSGTPKQGEAVYASNCLACHDEKGAGKPNDALVGGIAPLARDKHTFKKVGNSWPDATTIIDFVRRSIPHNES